MLLTEALKDAPGEADFAKAGTEQDAFAEYLAANYKETAFNEADTPASGDTRVVKAIYADTVVKENENGGNDITVYNGSKLGVAHGTDAIDNVFHAGGDLLVLPENVENVFLTGIGNASVVDSVLDNTIRGNAGDNRIFAGRGNDFVDGGTGVDALLLEGPASRYTVSAEGHAAVIADNLNGTETRVVNVQAVSFADDIRILFATDQTEIAGLYRALLDRSAEGDADGFGFWVGQSLAGSEFGAIATAIASSDEARNARAGKSTAEVVEDLYNDVLGRAADAAGKAYWVGQIDEKGVNAALVGQAFVHSAEFQLNGDRLVAGDWLA